MPTTYTNKSYSTTLYSDVTHGRRIMADNILIGADEGDYLADGSVNMQRPINEWRTSQILCNNTVILCNDRWTVLSNGCTLYTDIGYS